MRHTTHGEEVMADNKNLIDGRDDVAVNRSQDYEVRYFVDHYIRTRGVTNPQESRATIEAAVRAFAPTRKVFRDELIRHLDAKWNLRPLQK
jgi:hypothetical protein